MANTTGKKFGGRTKGTPNKLTTSVKEAILEAFDKVGGIEYLVDIAKDDPRTFCALLGRVLPLVAEHSGPNGGPIEIHQVNLAKLSDKDLKNLELILHKAAQPE